MCICCMGSRDEMLDQLFLRIVRAQVSDAAVYTCVAANRAGVDNKHYSLQVFGMCHRNDPITLLCQVLSNRLIFRNWLPQRFRNLILSKRISEIGSYWLENVFSSKGSILLDRTVCLSKYSTDLEICNKSSLIFWNSISIQTWHQSFHVKKKWKLF